MEKAQFASVLTIKKPMIKSWSQDNYIKAYKFAALAHRGQTLPGTDLPYLVHLSFVSMEIIAALRISQGHDEDLAVQSALLHDVIEDTDVTYEELSKEFGSRVADAVLALSKDKTLTKSLQMQDSLQRIKQQPVEVQMVKLADRISNLHKPPAHWTTEKIAEYRKEAIEIHDALKDANDFLAARLFRKIKEYGVYTESKE
jgi:(p)ppGpp synthase/HD superfamily hydrolase